jgi:hypothetical protein
MHRVAQPLKKISTIERVMQDKRGIHLLLQDLHLRVIIIETGGLALTLKLGCEHGFHVYTKKRFERIGDVRSNEILYGDGGVGTNCALANSGNNALGLLF